MPSSARSVLVITGMHRSGTSLLASLAVEGGIDMGAHLLPGSKGNWRGHFEDLELVRFHEGCLERRGAGPFQPPEEGVDPRAEEEREAAGILGRRVGKPAWGWKDPRTTLFLPFWDRLLSHPFYLLVYRHPVEVALSLLRRGVDLEVELDPRTAIRAWTAYNRQLLAFRDRCPERCLLWPISGATCDLGAALTLLARRSGLPFAGRGLERLYAPGELRHGLVARGIDWPALLPEAMALYAQLGERADLPPAPADNAPEPGLPQPERELRETNEVLLAALLGEGERGGAAGVSPRERFDFSELRLHSARQAERVEELERQLAAGREQAARREARSAALGRERAVVEATSGWRLLQAYWRSARRVEGVRRQAGWRLRRWAGGASPPRPEEIVVGCVAENDPRFLGHARRLARSLRWFGGSLAGARMLVCVVGGIAPEERRALERAGAEVRIVDRFDRRNPPANKLQFFPEALAAGARGLLLLDCDTIVVRDPWPLLLGGALQAKIADVPSVTHDAFERLFRHYGLGLPRRRYRTTLLPEPTIAYCNSGMVFLTAELARELVPVWQEWNARILDALDLLGPSAHHCHQASLSLALAARPIPFAPAPVELNFPLHMTHLPPSPALRAADPAILHYHKEVDADGCLLPTRYPLAQARIEAFNRRWRAETRA